MLNLILTKLFIHKWLQDIFPTAAYGKTSLKIRYFVWFLVDKSIVPEIASLNINGTRWNFPIIVTYPSLVISFTKIWNVVMWTSFWTKKISLSFFCSHLLFFISSNLRPEEGNKKARLEVWIVLFYTVNILHLRLSGKTDISDDKHRYNFFYQTTVITPFETKWKYGTKNFLGSFRFVISER